MFDGFDGRKFASTNPIHQFPRTMTFIRNFLNFCVKEGSLDVLNYLFETFPIVKTSCHSIVIEKPTTFFCPLLFRIFGNFWFLGIFCPCLVNNHPKLIDYAFQSFHVSNVRCVQVFDVRNDFFNKGSFLVAFWRNWKFWSANNLFVNGDING